MRKKHIGLILLVVILANIFIGCSKNNEVNDSVGDSSIVEDSDIDESETVDGDQDLDELQVGIILPTTEEPRWLQDKAQFEQILDKAGLRYEVLFSQGSSEVEKANIKRFISKGVDVLIICVQDGAVAADSIEEAKAAGVTVIAYDRLVTGTDAVDYFVTFDSFAVGVAQGTYIIENVGEGKNIPLYLYAGAVTDNNAYLYLKGAWSVLQPKIADKTFKIANSTEAIALMDKQELTDDELGKIMNQITTEWNFDSAKSKAEADLAAVGNSLKGDIAILAPNDGIARSLADVYEAAKGVSSFVITGMDSEKPSVQYVIDGKQSMTVFKDTRVLVADSVAMAVSILDGEKPVTDTVYNNGTKEVPTKQTDIVVVTRDNVKKALIDSGYYKLSDFEGIE